MVAVTTGIANTVPGAAAQVLAELLINVRRFVFASESQIFNPDFSQCPL
jgi:hypothetical protein